MELKFTRRERVVGLFMVGVALLLLAAVFLVGRGKDWFRTYVTFYTVFDETYNLKLNAAVKMSKADIGRVKAISLTEDKVKVELAVLSDYASRIKTDSIATVESPTFVGSEYVSIKPGSPKAAALKSGSQIHSEAKKNIEDIMDEFQVQETAKKFVTAVQELSDLTERLTSEDGPVSNALRSTENMMANLEAISKDIKEGKGSAGNILRSDELVKNINAEIARIDRVLADVEKRTPAMLDDVKTSVESLKKITANIESGSRDVPEITRSTKKGIEEIREGVKDVDSVVQSLKKAPIIRSNIPPARQGEITDAGLRK